MAATTLLLNKIAMALVIGLGPIFILCLLFDQTKQLFSRWLYYGIGTLFSMAFLTVMVTLALDMVIAVGTAFWAASWIAGGGESLTSMAMQQGGLGIVLSMLILSAPPMAAMFFQGTLGSSANFNLYSSFSSQASPPGSGLPPQAVVPPIDRSKGATSSVGSFGAQAAKGVAVPPGTLQGDAIKSGPR